MKTIGYAIVFALSVSGCASTYPGSSSGLDSEVAYDIDTYKKYDDICFVTTSKYNTYSALQQEKCEQAFKAYWHMGIKVDVPGLAPFIKTSDSAERIKTAPDLSLVSLSKAPPKKTYTAEEIKRKKAIDRQFQEAVDQATGKTKRKKYSKPKTRTYKTARSNKCGEGKCGAAPSRSTRRERKPVEKTTKSEDSLFGLILMGALEGTARSAGAVNDAQYRKAQATRERKAREQAMQEEQWRRERELQRQREAQIAERNAQIYAINMQKKAAWESEQAARRAQQQNSFNQQTPSGAGRSSGARSESRSPSRPQSRPTVARWKSETCGNYTHSDEYVKGKRLQQEQYHWYQVKVKNNCRYARLECKLTYSALTYNPSFYRTGGNSATGEPFGRTEQRDTLILEPGQRKTANELGPINSNDRGSGRYQVNCKKIGGVS